MFISYLLSGISLGAIYALIALGYTMVYGIAKMLNFAHGDVIMVGGYIAFTIHVTLGADAWVALLGSIVFCTLLGITIERVAYKPLRSASKLSVLITAIGVSYLLQNVALLIFGSQSRNFQALITIPTVTLGSVTIPGNTLLTRGVSVVIMTALTLFINKSAAGSAMLAVSEDKGAAELMGVNVNRTISLTFAIGSGLAAIAGILMCTQYPNIGPYTGQMPGIKAFIAAVFGGIGSIPGAMLGGIVIGVIENLSKAYISSQLSDAITFAILIIVLLVRPTGIMGRKLSEKV